MDTSTSLDVTDENCFIELLLTDFSCVLNKSTTPLCSDNEYMQLMELKFLLKNIRELNNIQMLQSFSRSDTLTYNPKEEAKEGVKGGNGQINTHVDFEIRDEGKQGQHQQHLTDLKRTTTDRLVLSKRRARLDAVILDLSAYVAQRLELQDADHKDGSDTKDTTMDTCIDNPITTSISTDQPLSEQATSSLPSTTPTATTSTSSVKRSHPLPRILNLCQRYNFTANESEIFHLMVVVQGSSNSHVLVCTTTVS